MANAHEEFFRSRSALPRAWVRFGEANVWGYEIAYDDDAKYFRCDGRVMPGSVEILVALFRRGRRPRIGG